MDYRWGMVLESVWRLQDQIDQITGVASEPLRRLEEQRLQWEEMRRRITEPSEAVQAILRFQANVHQAAEELRRAVLGTSAVEALKAALENPMVSLSHIVAQLQWDRPSFWDEVAEPFPAQHFPISVPRPYPEAEAVGDLIERIDTFEGDAEERRELKKLLTEVRDLLRELLSPPSPPEDGKDSTPGPPTGGYL